MFDRRLEDLSRDELIQLWIKEGNSDKMIAEMLHTTTSKVKQRRKELGVFLGCAQNPLKELSASELLQMQIAICRELELRLR